MRQVQSLNATVVVCLGLLACSKDPPGTGGTGTPTPLTDAAPKTPASVPVNVIPVPTASVADMVNPDHLPPYTGATGVVEGTVYVTGPVAPPMMGKTFTKCPAAAKVYAKTFRDGPALPDGRRPLADVVVLVSGYSGFIAAKSEAKLITIEQCAYSARTVTLTLGQRLEVQNKSMGLMYEPVLENQPAPAIMMAVPMADPIKLYPAKIGRYRVSDKGGNDWMEADLYVLGTPLHTASDVAGHYRIEGVPVGKLKIGARHPFIAGDVHQDIDVQSSTVTHVDITVPYTKDAPRPATIEEGPVLP